MAKSKVKAPAETIGLLTKRGEAIPLQGVRIAARLRGRAADLTVSQRYRNHERKPVEAVYLFPLPSEAAVAGLTIRVGERTLRAEIEEREKAFERYDEALREGHGAVLLDQERPNVFQVSVGSILPGQTVLVEIRLALLADSWDRGVRLLIPTTISPRYTPAALPADVLREIERTTPPYALEVPCGLSVEIDAETASPIRAVESPSHRVRAEIDGCRARVVFSHGEEAMDRDFVLAIETAEPHRAGAFSARRDGRDHLLVELRPELPQALEKPREVLFFVDCSGSMRGDSIDQARRAVELCLRALRSADRFQIVRFGNTHEAFFRKFQAYSQGILDAAVPLVRAMEADLGGTEILSALEAWAKPPGKRRIDAIVLTDGQVSNEEQVLSFARKHRDAVRFFSFGIGAGSSEFLVRGLARESGGEAEFIHPGERIEEKVLRQFCRISSPAVANLAMDWGGLAVEQAPAALPPVFPGDSFRAFARLRKDAPLPAGATVRLRGTTASGPVEWAAAVSPAGDGSAIPLLWARERLRELEAGFGVAAGSRQKRGEDRNARTIVDLSREYGVLCSATSFVAVQERPAADRAKGELQLRRVPAMVTAGWHGLGRGRVLGFNLISCCMPAGASDARALPRPLPGSVASADLFSLCEPRAARPGARSAPDPHWFISLLTHQRADGTFAMTEALLDAAQLTRRKADALRKKSGLDERTFATALAVAALRKHAARQEGAWRAAAAKAAAWLSAAGATVNGLDAIEWLLAQLR